MTTKGTSIFGQMVAHIDRVEFQQIVRKHNGDRHAKGFTSWEQLVSMLFCHLGKAQSLREICNGLATCLGKLTHLRMPKAPNRSTLSYANENRSWEMYKDVFHLLFSRFAATCAKNGKKPFRLKNKLYSMDATTIDLCLNLFPWAKFRQTKGAVKLHVLLDHDGYLPTFAHITEGLIHEITAAKKHILPYFTFSKGSIVVFDRGYVDYLLFADWCRKGITFVTRMKNNAAYSLLEEYALPRTKGNILSDQRIRFTGHYAAKNCPNELRRIAIWDSVNQKIIVLLTNNFDLAASTIGAIYKDRWQIEIFFKTLKQQLKIKTFVGTSPNALKVQIWTALIALLLLKYLKALSSFGWSFCNLVAMLRFNLFTYRDLETWLNNPYECPPMVPDDGQLAFPGFGLGQHQGAYSGA